jgi:hypothetical protein
MVELHRRDIAILGGAYGVRGKAAAGNARIICFWICDGLSPASESAYTPMSYFIMKWHLAAETLDFPMHMKDSKERRTCRCNWLTNS